MRYIIFLAMAVTDLFFTNIIFPNFSIAGLAPDIIICTMASVAILDESMAGAFIGLACGLRIDLFSGVIGFYALAYFLAGAAVYLARKSIGYMDKVLLPLALTAGAYVLKEGVCALLAYMLDIQFTLEHLWYILPEAAMTAALMLLVHFLMRRIYGLNVMKRKSAKDFRRLS